jgi:hypothetical protein
MNTKYSFYSFFYVSCIIYLATRRVDHFTSLIYVAELSFFSLHLSVPNCEIASRHVLLSERRKQGTV